MNNQYNPQQPTNQQSPTQPAPTAAAAQQPQQMPQQPTPTPTPQQPYMQPQYAAPKPYVDPSIAKKQKQDALNAFGDKLTDLMNTNPILKIIAQYADFISYGATGVCVLFTLIALIASNVNLIAFTLNLGGEIGGCFIFPILAIIFGGLSLCKKNMLPLTVSMSAVSALMFTRFIVNIVTFASIGDLASQLGGRSGGSFPGGLVINFIFMIIELAAVGFLTYICWTYFLATMPVKPVMQPQAYQQPYNVQQNNGVNMQQPAAPVQPVSAPVQTPVNPVQPVVAAPASQGVVCPNCQAVNSNGSAFCQKCGTKLS